ncbi:hypothetical protein AAE478_002938 [Parahypoxylon ruwenzoriense]
MPGSVPPPPPFLQMDSLLTMEILEWDRGSKAVGMGNISALMTASVRFRVSRSVWVIPMTPVIVVRKPIRKQIVIPKLDGGSAVSTFDKLALMSSCHIFLCKASSY